MSANSGRNDGRAERPARRRRDEGDSGGNCGEKGRVAGRVKPNERPPPQDNFGGRHR